MAWIAENRRTEVIERRNEPYLTDDMKIDIANPNQELKRNMPADAIIPLTPAAEAPQTRSAARLP